MKLMVILGSSRPMRRGEVVSKWVQASISKNSEIEMLYADVKVLNLPFYDEDVSPFSFKQANYQYKNPAGAAWAKQVADAEAYLIITPEYNHGYPAVLKNALDWVGTEWLGKPVGFISYSTNRTGGLRAVEQLRQVVVELGLYQVAQSVHIADVEHSFDAGGIPSPGLDGALDSCVKAIVDLQKQLN